jgi:hypothetical protein
MKIPVSFHTSCTITDKRILVDSQATDNFIDPCLISCLRLRTCPLEKAQKIWNIDSTTNCASMLTQYVDLEVQIGSKEEKMCFLVTPD